MSNRGFMALTFVLRMTRLMATGSMCWSALVLATALIAWPEAAGAQGVGEIVAVAKATGEIANNLPTDVTRLALQVAIVSMLVNAALIFAFWKVQMANANKPCIMSGATGQDILSNWFYRAFKAGTEKAESEKH